MQQSEEVYGSSFDSHPTVAATYIALGDLYEKMQAKDKAYAAFEKALSINSRIYGETHPFVLRAKQRLLKLS
ncbi:MAG: tetratricopeptide repeat protein [Chlamydiia bacterium]|nr:tetratricopeptide repeat protein [Chlamydiia bacterium]